MYANSSQLSLINIKHNNKRINYNNKSNNNKKELGRIICLWTKYSENFKISIQSQH